MSLVIPFRDLAAFRESVSLDGEIFILEFQYNTRGDYWSLFVYSKEGTPLLMGVKIVIDFELIQRYGTRNLPAGEIYGIDVTETVEKIGRRDLLDLVELVYLTEAELA